MTTQDWIKLDKYAAQCEILKEDILADQKEEQVYMKLAILRKFINDIDKKYKGIFH